MEESDGPSEAEGLRLMKAFFRITEAADRRQVVALAERLAERSGQWTPPSGDRLQQDNEPRD